MNKKRVDNHSFDNSWYKPGSWLKIFSWYFINVLFLKNPLQPSSKLKVFILKLFGAQVGKGVVLKQGINIKFPWKLSIGDYTWIGENVWIDNISNVTIGSNVCISQGAFILTGNHNYKKITFDLILGDVVLEDGVWIGAMATVCPGVVCSSHAVLSVGSIATSNLESYLIYQGVPAKSVRKREIE